MQVADDDANGTMTPKFLGRHRRFVSVLNHGQRLRHLAAGFPSVILGDAGELAWECDAVSAAPVGDEGPLVVLKQDWPGRTDRLPHLRPPGRVILHADGFGENVKRQKFAGLH